MSARETAERLTATVKDGANFCMGHLMIEYQHPSAPDITMAEHRPSEENCPACEAQKALDELHALVVAQADQLDRAQAVIDAARALHDHLADGPVYMGHLAETERLTGLLGAALAAVPVRAERDA